MDHFICHCSQALTYFFKMSINKNLGQILNDLLLLENVLHFTICFVHSGPSWPVYSYFEPIETQ